MKAKKKVTFVCSITDNALKVIKCSCLNSSKPEFMGLEVQDLPADLDDKKLSTLLQQTFKKLNYEHHPIVVCLPRSQATCRYIKIPATLPQEIENISNLQASRYLPYPGNELVTGFDIVSTESEGFSNINLIIVHKKTIERYFRILKDLKAPKISIVLSSYALFNLYERVSLEDSETVMIIDIDYQQAELAIVSSKKLLLSRSIKLSRANPDWISVLTDEINKTQETYLESVPNQAVSKITLMGVGVSEELKTNLEKQFSLPVEIISYSPKINLPQNLLNVIMGSQHSFAGLIGMCLRETEGHLNLIPQELKNEARKVMQRKTALQTLLLALVIIMTLGLGVTKHLDNKLLYLGLLKSELNKISQQAKPLEDIEKRFALLETRSKSKPSGLEILHELYQVVPSQLSLVSLTYEENKLLLLRGQSQELNSIFAFVGELEKSNVFKPFNIKVRYATKKRTSSGELVDFEIECLKK
jgi:Tfp pilus assembly PilM family ATPase